MKEHWLFQIIQHHYISLLITWGEVGHLSIAQQTDDLRALEEKIVICVMIYWHAIKCK